MVRRDLLKSAVATATLGLLGVTSKTALLHSETLTATTAQPRSAPFIDAGDGARLSYKEWGTGKPAVFLHGMGSSCDQWQYNMIQLARQDVRCVAYDRRGHGCSSDPGRGYDYDTLADDLAAVLEQRNLREVVLVGHSMGAGEAVRYLTRHGVSRIAGLILVGPTLPFILKTADNPDGVEKSFLDQQRATWCKDFPKWVSDNARPFFVSDTSAETVQWGVNNMLKSSLQAVIECHHTVTETDFRPELTKITVPTLIIHGDADVSANIDFTGRKVARLIRASQLKVYEGAAHGLFITHADRFNKDVFAFIYRDLS